MLKQFIKFGLVLIVLYTIISIIIAYYSKYNSESVSALIFAGILATINIVIVVFFLTRILKKPADQFLKAFWMSTLIRMLFLLAMFFTILTQVTLNHFVFTAAFFILYFLFQMIEIYILHTAKQFR